jgi:hypothetical protein
MGRKSYYASNLAVLFGIGAVAYVLYASFNRAMDWEKLVLFWVGAGGIAYFLLYRIFARVKTYRPKRSVYRYTRRFRIICTVLLLGGLWAGVGFNYQTWSAWQKPAVYWELKAQHQISPNQYQMTWLLGNQRYRETVHLLEIRLHELADVALTGRKEKLAVAGSIDSAALPLSSNAAGVAYKFLLPEKFLIPPLSYHTIELSFDYRQHFAIFELAASYHIDTEKEAAGKSPRTLTISTPQYLLLEPSSAGLVDFAELVNRVRRPSAQTYEPLILAIGRSRHPQAFAVLRELLNVRDPKAKDAACRGLAELKDARANSALIRLITNENNPQAVRALGMIGSEEGVYFLVRLLGDDQREPYIRAAAAGALREARLAVAVPALVELLQQKALMDAMVLREGLLALTGMNDSLAAQLTFDFAQESVSGEQIQILIEVLHELQRPESLPLFAEWLRHWRRYDLTLDDVQAMLDYLAAGGHTNMVATLIEILHKEPTAEAQSRFVQTLSKLVQKDLGTIHYPALNNDMLAANERVITAWQKWWGSARKDPAYSNSF